MTEKLYYKSAYISSFDAVVTSCEKCDKGYAITLSQTAFFPEEGGQLADKGKIEDGLVLDVKEIGHEIFHYVENPFDVGQKVHGEIDFARRFRFMQAHTAEHILSGFAHSIYGAKNVGFHLGEEEVTCDYDIPFTDEQIRHLENQTNAAIFANVPVVCSFPSGEALSQLSYRSKLDLKENVRIVNITGYDICACCAPHVAYTGEVGQLRVVFFEHYKGGTRCYLKAGHAALAYSQAQSSYLASLSHMLSSPQESCVLAVEKLLKENADLRYQLVGLKRKQYEKMAASIQPEQGCLFLFLEANTDTNEMRHLMNLALERSSVACGCYAGDDIVGYTFVLAKHSTAKIDLQQIATVLRQSHGAKCGGSAAMISGRLPLTQTQIRTILLDLLQ